MKILITESQRKMILTENVLDELTRKISNISESGKEVIETASQQLGINLKFLLTCICFITKAFYLILLF